MSLNYKIVAISAPSGAGKTSVCKGLLKKSDIFEFSISITSRKRRGKEIDGQDYIFVREEDFIKLCDNGELIEWENVYGNWYGTQKRQVELAAKNKRILLLDVDVKGALNVKKIFGDSTLAIYIDISKEVLAKRLTGRGTESEEQILERIQYGEKEVKSKQKFDVIVVNDNLEKTIETVYQAIQKKRR